MSREYQRRSKSATAFLYTGLHPEGGPPQLIGTLSPSSPTFKVDRIVDRKGVSKPSLVVDVTKLVTKERFTEAIRELSNMFLDALSKHKDRCDESNRRIKRIETQVKKLNDNMTSLQKLVDELKLSLKEIQPERVEGSNKAINQLITHPDFHDLKEGLLHLQDTLSRTIEANETRFKDLQTACTDNTKATKKLYLDMLASTGTGPNEAIASILEQAKRVTQEKIEITIQELETLRGEIAGIKRKQIKMTNSIDDLTTNTEHDVLKLLNDQEILRTEVKLLAKAVVKLQTGDIAAQEGLAKDFENVRNDVYRRVDDLAIIVQEALSKLCR
ncbi:Hypothetical protein GLP15_3548 [Giardia lamblia P15]|uniref:Uncharacterized protein n=1 Tax=Giardia intestinalis (strain P15) TaxID=658858 RepID=E1F7J5_GIAIA|nr:Hypothetical protein GLP15_3548 [Giardia lamblia P15]